MSNIVIGFSRPKAWFEPFSWLIRLATWAPYSHTYIRFYSEEYERWIVYQASGLEVNFVGQKVFDSVEDIYDEFIVPVSDETKKAVIQNAIDLCGSSYDLKGVLGMLFVLFMRAFGKSVGNPLSTSSSFWCSELVADILVEVGDGSLKASTMTPKDVYNFMVSKGAPKGLNPSGDNVNSMADEKLKNTTSIERLDERVVALSDKLEIYQSSNAEAHERQEKSFDKLTESLCKIDNSLQGIDITVAKQEVSLTEHIKRTKILEDKLEPVEAHVKRVEGALKMLGIVSIFVTIVAGAIEIWRAL